MLIFTLWLLMAWCGQSIITQQDPSQLKPGKADPRNHYYLSPQGQTAPSSGTSSGNKTKEHFAAPAKAAAAPQATNSNGALICGPDTTCSDGSCCGSNNLCGYGSDYCGNGCQSQCDAKAGCGRDSAGGSVPCGMNLCCSYYGWCGTSADYCTPGNDGCQQGFGSCQTHEPFQCSGTSATGRTIGYYQGGNVKAGDRKCQKVLPSMIKADKYTHLYWAFADINPTTYEVMPADSADEATYTDFTDLRIPGKLQTWIAIGGFDFTTANPKAWSEMVATPQHRQTFITSLVAFMKKYNFEGVDLDWEYPVDDNRGGSPDDMKNLVQLLADMRANADFGHNFGISATLAPDLWYLQHFDAKGLLANADFLGFMSYDLHGTWDADVPQLGKRVYGQTNVHDIERDLVPLWFDLTPDDMNRLNFGLALYGRGYTLADPNCNTADGTCSWTDGNNPGPCTATTGVLSRVEIEDIIKTKQLTPVALTDGKGDTLMKQITWDDQWIGYDDDDTVKQKIAFASSRCFGGTMSWSVDLEAGSLDDGGVPKDPIKDHPGGSEDCFWTSECSYDQIHCGNGKSLTYRFNFDQCENKDPAEYQSYCCPQTTTLTECVWRGEAWNCEGDGPDCHGCINNSCNNDEVLLLYDKYGQSQGTCDPPGTTNPQQYALCCKDSETPAWYETAFPGIYWQDAKDTCTTDELKILVEATRMADEMINKFVRKGDYETTSAFNRYFFRNFDSKTGWTSPDYQADYDKIRQNIQIVSQFPTRGKKNSRGESGRTQKVGYRCKPPAGTRSDCFLTPKSKGKYEGRAAETHSPGWDVAWSIMFCPKFFYDTSYEGRCRYINDITMDRHFFRDIPNIGSYEQVIAHEWMHAWVFGYKEFITDVNAALQEDRNNGQLIYGDSRANRFAFYYKDISGKPNEGTRHNADSYALMFAYDWFKDVYNWDDEDGAWPPPIPDIPPNEN